MFVARQPYKPIFKLRRSGTESFGEPPTTGLQSSRAAPTELDRAGRRRCYKHVAPNGACTDPCQNPCKVQGRAKRRRRLCSGTKAVSRSRLPTALHKNWAGRGIFQEAPNPDISRGSLTGRRSAGFSRFRIGTVSRISNPMPLTFDAELRGAPPAKCLSRREIRQ